MIKFEFVIVAVLAFALGVLSTIVFLSPVMDSHRTMSNLRQECEQVATESQTCKIKVIPVPEQTGEEINVQKPE